MKRQEHQCQVAEKTEDFGLAKRSDRNNVLQAAAGDVLHDQEWPFVRDVEVEHADQAGLVHGRTDSSLAAEPRQCVVVGRGVLSEELDRNGNVEDGVPPGIYDTHPTATNFSEDARLAEKRVLVVR